MRKISFLILLLLKFKTTSSIACEKEEIFNKKNESKLNNKKTIKFI